MWTRNFTPNSDQSKGLQTTVKIDNYCFFKSVNLMKIGKISSIFVKKMQYFGAKYAERCVSIVIKWKPNLNAAINTYEIPPTLCLRSRPSRSMHFVRTYSLCLTLFAAGS